MAETREQKLERLQRKRDQLNAQISKEAARQHQRQRKEREGRLMRWGVALDAAVQSGEVSADWLAGVIDRHLTRETDRRRAYTGPLAGLEPEPDLDAQDKDKGASTASASNE